MDYAEIMKKVCDILFLVYNKFNDKSCFQPDLVEFATQLDEMIYEYVIKAASEDLQKLAEHCVKKEFDTINKDLDKYFN